jgi:hypothetical protein
MNIQQKTPPEDLFGTVAVPLPILILLQLRISRDEAHDKINRELKAELYADIAKTENKMRASRKFSEKEIQKAITYLKEMAERMFPPIVTDWAGVEF